MKKLVLVFSALVLVLAACSSDNGSQVASLEDASVSDAGAVAEVDADATNEEAILEFSQCMRDEGIIGFEDPDIGEDGTIEFRFGGRVDDADVDRDTMRAAFEACQNHLEGLAFGPGSIDRSEIEDTLLEFAVCMREHGVDMPDPDFSTFGPGGGGGEGEGGIFGGAIDLDDPNVATALEACQEIFSGSLRFGGPGGRGNG
jgi:hypothetical protein